MKRDRPGGKQTGPLPARGADQPVKVSPLDEIVEFPFRLREEQEAKTHQKRLREIKSILRKLGGCCQQHKFQWPDKTDLERLDLLVSELVRWIRKRPQLPRWKWYKAVDDHWHLRLWQTIENLVERAARNTPPRPLEKYNRKLSDDSLVEMTKKFLDRYAEVIRGRNAASVAWEEFDELFAKVTGKCISRRIPLTSAKDVTYRLFLELFCADRQWTTKQWKGACDLTFWVARKLQYPQMLRKLTRFLISPDIGDRIIENTEQLPNRFAEETKKAKRARDRDRKGRK